MSTPSFLESHSSQIPAVQVLQAMGYSYLSPEEVALERRGRLGNVLLEGLLAKQLKRLNRVRSKGVEQYFTDEAVQEAIRRLAEVPYDGLCRTSEKIYDLLNLGTSVDQTIEGVTKGYTMHFIDWAHPRNNVFHVTTEYRVARTASQDTRRPDIVCFVNGIPFVVIECKRRDEKHSLEAAIKQNIRNWQPEEIPQLYTYATLALALNKEEGRYGTTGTPEKFWSAWKELYDVSKEVHVLINQAPRLTEHEKLFSGEFAYAKEYFENLASNGAREVTGQDALLHSLCRPERLLDIARGFVVFDEGGTVKKVARYQQYFAIKKTLERVRQKDTEGRRKGGVIWHTQGSGKSLTMVMLGKALALDTQIPSPRIVLVTDRVDLDEQIFKTFVQCGKEPLMARTGSHLLELLANDGVPVVTTVLDKFRAASNANNKFQNPNPDIFVLVDESHRSQYGQANIRMQKALPNACFLGFTGTPLMKVEKNTAQRFGGFIDPAYTIRDAVDDGAVVPLLYEGRHIMQEVNQKAVDRMFDEMAEGLSPEQKADLKRKFASRNELNRLESRLYLIAHDVAKHYRKTWKGTGFKGQLTAPGKKEALMIKRFMDQFCGVTSEVLISGPDEREGDGEDPADENVMKFWKDQMAKHGNEKEYNRNVINSFKHGDDPEIIIVVDKLLTGFDAPRNVVLYIARNLKEHTLLQAIARVNRLHPGKDFGYIIDYFGVITQLHDALELYSSLGEKFHQQDLDGALQDVRDELKRLPTLRDALWDLFRTVTNKADDEAYIQILEDELVREKFYVRLSEFSRLLKAALSTLYWLSHENPETVERYKKDAAFFQSLRASAKLRYAEEVDYRDYEKQIQKMLSTFVQADEVIQVVDPVNIFERKAFQAEVDKVQSPRAKADTIANRIKKTIAEKMDEDPFLYRKLSALLQETIDKYRDDRRYEAEYLSRVVEILEQVRQGRRDDTPEILKERDLAKAVYGTLQDRLQPHLSGFRPTAEEESVSNASSSDKNGSLMANLACEIEEIVLRHAVVRWRDNMDAQNRMRNELDDLLFDIQNTQEVHLEDDELDAIIDSIIQIARSRQDV
ncbi:MAG: type I restriction endonuclease subunit R [Verrucomicrobiota bacterium JB022]|nr:type I restriction endonuclease subunit R [Verrucomicrobiota bacterium JB022]